MEGMKMKEGWFEKERIIEADRERELEKKRVVYIKSDLYPEGEFVPELDARLSVFDRGFSIGDSAYEYGRTYRHKPFQIDQNMDRMFSSLKVQRINPGYDKKEFCGLCEEVTKRNIPHLEKYEDYNIVWEVTRGDWGWHGRRTPAPVGSWLPTVIIKNNLNDQRLCAYYYYSGVHVVTPPGRHVSPQAWDPKIKTYSRLNYVMADLEARLVDPGATALMLDESGNITEAIGANICLVRDGALMTPTDRNILRGTNRNYIMAQAKELDIPVIEKDLQPWHLYNCEEAFLCTTYPGPMSPIGRFNGILIGNELPGPVTKRLAGAMSDWVGIDVTGQDRLSNEEKAEFEKERARLNEERGGMAHIPY
jgi:branched-subunit amino acid aminotransferase/4-amino-4-deoxychorismate lyase